MVEIKRGEKIAPCSCFKQISKGRTRRNLEADPRESRVRRGDGWMDGVACHREGWGHLRRPWAPRIRTERRRGGSRPSYLWKGSWREGLNPDSSLSLHFSPNPTTESTSRGIETIFPQCSVWGKGSNSDERELPFTFIFSILILLSTAAATSINRKSRLDFRCFFSFFCLRAGCKQKQNPRFPVVGRREVSLHSSVVCF
jgi:hypothetical protein